MRGTVLTTGQNPLRKLRILAQILFFVRFAANLNIGAVRGFES